MDTKSNFQQKKEHVLLKEGSEKLFCVCTVDFFQKSFQAQN
jgi:hypothetical protein